MLKITIPGKASYELYYLLLDMNGTIALNGEVIEGVRERIQRASELLKVFVLTADTFGTASRLSEQLTVETRLIKRGREDAQKLSLLKRLGKERTICIGNGSNDAAMLKDAAIGICVLGKEGASVRALMSSDLAVTDINSALDLILHTDRLIATLRV